MIYQWYVFVLIVVVAFCTFMIGQTKMVNSYGLKEQRYELLPVLAIVLPLIYWAGTREDMVFGDTSAYRIAFKNSASTWSEIPNIIAGDGKDKGFSILVVILKSIIGNRDVIYFTIVAAVCLGLVFGVYKKYSCAFAITAFLFVASTDYVQWCYNGIRQFIVVAVCFACIDLIIQKKYIQVIIIVLIVSTIHATALLMIPIIFIVQGKPWNRKTLIFIALILLAVAYVEQFTDILAQIMENSQYSSEVEQFTTDEGSHVLRVIVYGIPAILALIFKDRIEEYNNPLINVCINMSIISMCFYLLATFTSGIFIGRIPIYFSLYNYILLPWEINVLFNRKSAWLINICMIVMYMAYYYYQAVISWGL